MLFCRMSGPVSSLKDVGLAAETACFPASATGFDLANVAPMS